MSARGSYAKSERVRDGILQACITAFREHGYHGASMAEIARRAGISHTGLLHHFPRKEDLLAAVLNIEDERAADALRAAGTLALESDTVERVRAILASFADRNRDAGLIEVATVLTGEAASDKHPAHEQLATRYTRTRRFLARIFAQLQADGRLADPMNPEVLAMVTVALAEGLQIQRLYEPDLDIEAAMTAVFESLIPELRR